MGHFPALIVKKSGDDPRKRGTVQGLRIYQKVLLEIGQRPIRDVSLGAISMYEVRASLDHGPT